MEYTMADHTQIFATIDKSQSSKCWEFVQVWAYYLSGYPDQVHAAATLPASGTISERERTMHLLCKVYSNPVMAVVWQTAENETRTTHIRTHANFI